MRSVPYDGAYTFSGGDFVEEKVVTGGTQMELCWLSVTSPWLHQRSRWFTEQGQPKASTKNIVDYNTLKDDEMGQIDTFRVLSPTLLMRRARNLSWWVSGQAFCGIRDHDVQFLGLSNLDLTKSISA